MKAGTAAQHLDERSVVIPLESVMLEGDLHVPEQAQGIVLFAHGSGSSRHSPRNRQVARVLNDAGLATLLVDLLTREEERIDAFMRHLRFDIDLLALRLIGVTGWLAGEATTRALTLGYFGASTGAGAALVAAGSLPGQVGAVVSRGGRPDLAGAHLSRVQAPTLLIVGGDDTQVLALNRDAMGRMRAERELVIVPGATHLFEEPGALVSVAKAARDWFLLHLSGASWEVASDQAPGG
jgi:dienelactone hydrolase